MNPDDSPKQKYLVCFMYPIIKPDGIKGVAFASCVLLWPSDGQVGSCSAPIILVGRKLAGSVRMMASILQRSWAMSRRLSRQGNIIAL